MKQIKNFICRIEYAIPDRKRFYTLQILIELPFLNIITHLTLNSIDASDGQSFGKRYLTNIDIPMINVPYNSFKN